MRVWFFRDSDVRNCCISGVGLNVDTGLMRPCLRLNAYLIGFSLHGRHITCRKKGLGSRTACDNCRGVLPVLLMPS